MFRSERYDIYYDTVPPKPEFSNWRDDSSRPTDMRPDLCLVDRIDRVGVLMDAKYRVAPSGQVPTSALENCQVYMQSFDRKRIVVCYPGRGPHIAAVSGDDYTILEVSLGPFDGLMEYVANEVRPRIEEMMEPLAI